LLCPVVFELLLKLNLLDVKISKSAAFKLRQAEKGYKPANPDKPMGEKKKKRRPKKTYHYEYK